ncbi:MAG: DNA-directed RNA polymerase subunit alpha [Ktedonobacterales bacterium]|nr:DNA-directed RNA polymerase subunit alpha [Ktedonobacterales bacterium]
MSQPHITAIDTTLNYGRFIIEPLEAGYGRTLGNSLRRVLLSSLPGAAVTSIKINGVNHEFQDVAHVKEDVTEIVLNVKRLRLRSFSDSPVEMHLDVMGEQEVTAADIQAPSQVEIVTPNLHIATLDSADARLGMELVVEKGKGYRPVDPNEEQPIGQIPIDAIFTPVYKVNYTVENTRVGQMTNFDRIVMEIWTDGTVAPEEALRQSADILVNHFSLISNYQGIPTIPGEVAPTTHKTLSDIPIPASIYETPIEDLDLSVRAYNCLKRSNITRVGQVLTMSQDDLLAVRNFGEKSLTELRDKLIERTFLPDVGTGDNGMDDDDLED